MTKKLDLARFKMNVHFRNILTENSQIKIVYVLLDGVGDLPHPDIGNKTPLQAAKTPNMDQLAKNGKMGEVISFSAQGIGNLFREGENPGLTGPIGIAQVTGEVAKVGIAPIFELTALISISLGIVNLLPIPALDGGRLMFVLLEGIRGGKRISPQKEGFIHLAGFMLLIGLVVVMSYFDIMRILSGERFF